MSLLSDAYQTECHEVHADMTGLVTGTDTVGSRDERSQTLAPATPEPRATPRQRSGRRVVGKVLGGVAGIGAAPRAS